MIVTTILFLLLFFIHLFNRHLWTLLFVVPIALIVYLITSGNWFSVSLFVDIYLFCMLFGGSGGSSTGGFGGGFGSGLDGGGFDGGGGD